MGAAEIAKETAREIENVDQYPKKDTKSQLGLIKTEAKVKIINEEAKRQSEHADKEVEKGKIAERFSKKMTKHMKEIAKKNEEMVKESAEKKARIAFMES